MNPLRWLSVSLTLATAEAPTVLSLIINVEYDEPPEQCCLNYYNCYWGNKKFNELLLIHKLRYEYYDNCVAFIYKDYDY